MKPSLIRRAMNVNSRMCHVSIEQLFWTSLDQIAESRATTTLVLIDSIDAGRAGACLSSAIRGFVLNHFLEQIRDIDDALWSDLGDQTGRARSLH
jgi:predicted DNA-binding ribbon-helix-helix protein